MKNFLLLISMLSFLLIDCESNSNKAALNQKADQLNLMETVEDSLMNLVQKQTISYFWKNAEPNSGLARERTHMDGIYAQNDQNVVTSGGSGFGLMAMIVGVERGFIEREQAIERFFRVLDFLETADSFHGAFPHWWHGASGKVKAFSPKDDGGDLVETAFLIQGLLTAKQYFDRENERESEIRKRITRIWENVEWNWYTKGEEVLYWHWSPNHGWDMNFAVRGYNECLIMYVLAAASPTYPVKPEVYHKGWAMEGRISSDREYLGYQTVLDHYETSDSPVGPLFWAHYSYLGLNPKGLKDRYGDYWKLNVNHAKIHHTYSVQNPNSFKGYSEKCWGLTSSYSMNGYAGHKPDHDLGVISPTAALSSFPYTPDESMKFLKFMYLEADTLVGQYGPYDAFSFQDNWYLPRYLAIDQGPIPVMIENHRTGLLWKLFMSSPEVKVGLERLGFTNEL
ncbi:MAG: glucoamylase family protein [Bacteroidota bacterium]